MFGFGKISKEVRFRRKMADKLHGKHLKYVMERLEDEDDLWSIGYEDYVKQDGFVLCEWSENIEELLPDDKITVTVSRVTENENSRLIKTEIPEELAK